MRFVADESCDFNVVRALRDARHDVVAICETSPSMPDAQVAQLAVSEGRVLLTEDRDFGEFVHAHNVRTGGVVYIRYPARARSLLPDAVLGLVREHGSALRKGFVTMEPGRYRMHQLPAEE